MSADSDLLAQARLIVLHRSPVSKAVKEAAAQISKLKLDVDALGRPRWSLCMALRGTCLTFRHLDKAQQPVALVVIERLLELIGMLDAAPAAELWHMKGDR